MKLPPLKALLYFNMVAEHKSFSKAAEVLNVTTGAISQQIKSLEAFLKCQLIERSNRLVKLTSLGIQYWQDIQPALEQINNATEKLKPTQNNTVRLRLINTLAMQWLIPRLPEFYAKYPEISLSLTTTTYDEMFTQEPIDLSITFRQHKPKNIESQKLWEDELCLVYVPNLKAPQSPDEWNNISKIRVDRPIRLDDWERFAQHNLLNLTDKFITFNNTIQAIEAAKSGTGFLVTHLTFVEQDILQEKLSTFGSPAQTGYSYYLEMHHHVGQSQHIKTVQEWLLKIAIRS